MSASKKFFTDEKRKAVMDAIAHAEKQTSGEIRLFIEDTCSGDVLDRAAFIFKELKMHKTSHRNGVLFYVALESQKFAILGDAGINSKVKPDFWDAMKHEMKEHFKNNDLVSGLTKGINMAGDALQKHFPFLKSDKNELSDEIVFGK